jgi:hypothetical protein
LPEIDKEILRGRKKLFVELLDSHTALSNASFDASGGGVFRNVVD